MKYCSFGKNIISGIMIAMLIIFSNESWAIPSFARQTNLPCSSCHTIFPELNAFGRLYKINGYTLVGTETIQISDTNDNKELSLLKVPPVSSVSYTHLR